MIDEILPKRFKMLNVSGSLFYITINEKMLSKLKFYTNNLVDSKQIKIQTQRLVDNNLRTISISNKICLNHNS